MRLAWSRSSAICSTTRPNTRPTAAGSSLSVAVAADTLTLTVSDNGIGITPKMLPHLFEPFVHDTQALGFNGVGLGIGLTVVRALVASARRQHRRAQRGPQSRQPVRGHAAVGGERSDRTGRGLCFGRTGRVGPGAVSHMPPTSHLTPSGPAAGSSAQRNLPESAPQGLARDPRYNRLLASLPEADWLRWRPQLESIAMPLGQVMYEPGAMQSHVYFPTSAIVALMYVTENGASAEIAVVGNEGIVGISLFMGGGSTPSRAVVRNAGEGFRMPGPAIREEFSRSGP